MNKKNIKSFMNWSLTFTKKIIMICTVMWILYTAYSAAMIFFAVWRINDFSYLDTFIHDNGETFRLLVGVNIVSKTIENLFKYNDSPFFGKSIKPEPDSPEGDKDD